MKECVDTVMKAHQMLMWCEDHFVECRHEVSLIERVRDWWKKVRTGGLFMIICYQFEYGGDDPLNDQLQSILMSPEYAQGKVIVLPIITASCQSSSSRSLRSLVSSRMSNSFTFCL